MDMSSMLCLQKIAEMHSQRVSNPNINKNGEQQLQAQCSSEQCQEVEEKVKVLNDTDEVTVDRSNGWHFKGIVNANNRHHFFAQLVNLPAIALAVPTFRVAKEHSTHFVC
jgi:hypothetical protein